MHYQGEQLIQEITDLTIIIRAGLMVSRCLAAAEPLASEGTSARVIEMHTIRPLDCQAMVAAAEETGAIVTAQEHTVLGGLGSGVAEVTAAQRPVPILRVGINDRFAESGPYDRILEAFGMGASTWSRQPAPPCGQRAERGGESHE